MLKRNRVSAAALSGMLLIGITGVGSFASLEARELSNDVKGISLGVGNVTSVSREFSGLSWTEIEDGKESRTAGLELFGQPVVSVKLLQPDGYFSEMEFELLSKKMSASMPAAEFRKQAGMWKKKLDAQFGSKGKLMPKFAVGPVNHTRVAWKRSKSIVVLSSQMSSSPERLTLSMFDKKRGLSQFKLKGQQLKDFGKVTKKTTPVIERREDLRKDPSGIRKIIREISSRKAPSGISRKVQKAVNLLNVYRYLSGVSYDVVADEKMIAAAIDAAGICKKKGTLSHDFGHSTDKSNLAMDSDRMTMEKSVQQYMEDSGANNRERRGHRRWCLNHTMGRTGFGLAGDYSAMFSIDQSARPNKKNYSYPGHGLYPIKYLHGNGWSYHLVRGSAPAKCSVKVWLLSRDSDKLPGWSETPAGKTLPVRYVKTYLDTIIFEPQSDPVTKKGYYLVRIKGKGLKEQYIVKLF